MSQLTGASILSLMDLEMLGLHHYGHPVEDRRTEWPKVDRSHPVSARGILAVDNIRDSR